jgi:hypothetical protein
MAMPETRIAADQYAARVDAVLAQRTRLRGPQPPGDLFAGLPADHPLLKTDPRRPLDPNLEIIASYIAPDDVVIDVGGGAGRISLPLALRCREVINVEPSCAMATGFTANAAQAGITNVCAITDDWLTSVPPVGTVALVTMSPISRERSCHSSRSWSREAGGASSSRSIVHPRPPGIASYITWCTVSRKRWCLGTWN